MKIDFYILEYGNRDTKALFACELLEKAYQTSKQVHVLTASKEDALKFDQLLWTYREDSFIPHDVIDKANSEITAITIGYDQLAKHREVLINLTDTIADNYQQFERMIEIITNDPNTQSLARDRYRKYREQGFELTTHKIKR